MKVRKICAVLLFLALLSGVSIAAAQEYQAGRIVKVEKQQSHSASGGTDSSLGSAVATYHVSIQLGDRIYVCQYKTDSENDISWTDGKDVQARVSGKAIYVKKVTGKEVRGSILSTSPAEKM